MSACSTELARTTLTRRPAVLEGDWRPDPHGWRWTGQWQADVPLVGLVMCQTGGSTHWARSSHRSTPDGLEIVLHCMARKTHVMGALRAGHAVRSGNGPKSHGRSEITAASQ